MKSRLLKGIACAVIGGMAFFSMASNALAYDNSPYLSAINVSNGQLAPAFHPNCYEYTLALDIGSTTATVAVTPDDPNAAATINGETVGTVVMSSDAGGVSQAVIVVTSADGLQTSTYTIHLATRTSNADLSRIEVFGDILSPYFDPDIQEYTLTSQNSSSCTVSISLADPFASATINGVSGKTTVKLQENSTSFPNKAVIVVTAADGVTKKTYNITMAENSTNADLTSISVRYGSLSPEFSTSQTTYYAIPNSPVSIVDLMIVPMDSRGTIRVNSSPLYLANSEYTYRLGYASNLPKSAVIEVTASNGTTKKIYTVYFAINQPVASASATDYKSVKVSWNAVVDAKGYMVYRSTSLNGTYEKIASCSMNTLSYTNTGLSTGKTYFYKVKAYDNSWGPTVSSALSAPVSATPMLGAVTNPSAAVTSPTSIKVSWSAVSGRTNYEVWRGTTPDTSKFTKIATTTSTSYKNTGLAPFVTYYYQIKVYRTVSGQKVYSSSASPTASARPTLNNVTNVKAASASASSIKVTWNSVSGCSGYEVLRSTSPSSGFTVIKSTTSRSYTDSNRIPNTTYYYQVRAYCKVGSSRVYSTAMTVSAAPYFGPVTGAKAVMSSASSIKISWKSVSGRTGYEVYRSTSPDGVFTLIKTTTSTSYTNSNLVPNTTYYYKVLAYRTVSGTKYRSQELAVATTVSAVPYFGPVTGAKAVMASAGSIKISWKSVSGRTGYEIYRSTLPDGVFTLIKTTTSTSYTNTNLVPNTTYYYKVLAYRTVSGTKYRSQELEAVTAVSATPYFAPVSAPKAARYNSTKIKLTWNSVSGRTGYEIYRSTSPDGGFVSIGTTTSTSYYSGGLTTGVTYYYKVLAYRTVNGVKYSQTLESATVVSAKP